MDNRPTMALSIPFSNWPSPIAFLPILYSMLHRITIALIHKLKLKTMKTLAKLLVIAIALLVVPCAKAEMDAHLGCVVLSKR